MLKAQAVAARTYALYQQMLSHAGVRRGGCGVKSIAEAGLMRDPARGRIREASRDLPGCADLRSLSSTAAGLTEDAMNVWSKEYPYLKGVDAPSTLGRLLSMEVLLHSRHPRTEFATAGIFRGNDRDDDALVVQPRASREAAHSPFW
jgi:peptidoglycan hydrolase-like amidase